MMEFAQMGVSAEDRERAKQVGEYYSVVIRKYYKDNKFEVQFNPRTTEAAANIPQIIDGMVLQLATQLSTFFGIQGKVQEVE